MTESVEVPIDRDNDNDNDNKLVPSSEAESKVAWYKFDHVALAQGYNALGVGRGALVMSNIFLSTSFIFLASEDAGCLNDEGDEILDDCDGQVYGFKPASFVSNIAVISGVLSALFMPMFGAMVDYTSHRRTVGIGAAIVMMMIQVAQIGTVQKTWLAMAILQAVTGFFYQVEILATYAYLPDIARQVGEHRMTRYSATFVMTQFGSQSAFLVVVIILSFALGVNDVQRSHLSQSVNVLWSSLFLFIGWKILPNMPPSRSLPDGHSLFTEGFVQIFRTAKHINSTYCHGLRWYLLAVIFAEAAANAFTVVSVIFLDEQIGMSGEEIGIFFLITLIGSLPGSVMAKRITSRMNPNTSWQLSMLCLMVWAAGGAVAMDFLPKMVTFFWGFGVGMCLGWFYPTENLFFSMCLPKGQEAELAGFFVYCTQILGWLPPLIFTGLVEADVSQTYAVVAITVFFLVAIAILRCASPWEEILRESGRLEEDTEDDVLDDDLKDTA